MIKLWICDYCKNYTGRINNWTIACKAYPDGIPIMFCGSVIHCHRGFKYEMIDDFPDYARNLLKGVQCQDALIEEYMGLESYQEYLERKDKFVSLNYEDADVRKKMMLLKRDRIKRELKTNILKLDSWSDFKKFRDETDERIDYSDPTICEHIAELAIQAEMEKTPEADDAYRFCTKNKIGRWYKNNDCDKVWWLDIPGSVGLHIFSFDKYDKFNLFQEYPYRLSEEQLEVFNRENPYWHNFFIDRFQ